MINTVKHKVKVTVIDKKLYPELQKQFCADPEAGACEIAEHGYSANREKTGKLKKQVLHLFDESGIEYRLNGNQDFCINSTMNVCIPGVMSEALMISPKQYCSISNGSACTSKSYAPSYVLSAMGVPESDIECSVRISWGPDTSSEELSKNLVKLIEIAKRLKC